MRSFLAAFVVVLGLGALGTVSGELFRTSMQQGLEVEPTKSGFLGTVMALPKKIVVGIFKAIGATLRLIFVRIPDGLLELIKRSFYRVAHVFGKKDPYDPTFPLAPLTSQQNLYRIYNPAYTYGSSLYRNPYGKSKI